MHQQVLDAFKGLLESMAFIIRVKGSSRGGIVLTRDSSCCLQAGLQGRHWTFHINQHVISHDAPPSPCLLFPSDSSIAPSPCPYCGILSVYNLTILPGFPHKSRPQHVLYALQRTRHSLRSLAESSLSNPTDPLQRADHASLLDGDS